MLVRARLTSFLSASIRVHLRLGDVSRVFPFSAPAIQYIILEDVKRLFTILFLLLLATAAMAQDAPVAPGLEFQSLDEWMQDNIDDDVLRALNQLDQDRVHKIFTELEQAMAGTNIYQLSTLRQTATELVPLLDKFEETAPYAAWLKTHLDYLDAAGKMKRQMVVAPKPGQGTIALPAAPPLKLQRQVWVEELKQRPWPPLAQSYVPSLKKIFLAERVPTELVWLAEVESGFDAKARSPAGAAGMFQLMPATARDQKLSIFPFDERLQPEKAARASARYLRELHNHYNNWQLTLAAYNSGRSRVDKLLKQYKTHSFDIIARRLPAETQMYVPKIEATIRKREDRTLADLK
ncbi:MAG: Lytic transglycosylase catalytic [Pedosphaera sp.]|nr:Lytic transglycosylase catalytic [Pedosphaera sp.]